MTTSRILCPDRNMWQQVRADDSHVIVDAADYYRAFYAAAERAERYILVSGWQFDRGVKLLRGTHAVGHGDEVKLVEFLDGLCQRKPALRIYLLAWDFHMIFALEREWMQRVWFHYATNERLVFRFDDAVADQGSHHQKFAVIDGVQSFLGGIDLCESRWDDREHRTENALRTSRGKPHKPYHDLQAHLEGPAVGGALRELFLERWSRCGGDALTEAEVPPPEAIAAVNAASREQSPCGDPAPCISLGPALVALSRTDPLPKEGVVKEVEHLFVDAINAAERLIYIETQYFSSTRIRDTLIERMQDAGKPKLEIVVVVNPRAEAFKEEIAVGLRQAKNLERLREVATQTGHALGLYYSLSDGVGEGQRPTYIHSKLLTVDDRFLTVGSANLTNRSMEVDSELHVSWETTSDDPQGATIAAGIRRVRVSLLAEHAGLGGCRDVRALLTIPGLVARLDALTERPGARLRLHPPPTEGQKTAMAVVDPEDLPFDPAPSLENEEAR